LNADNITDRFYVDPLSNAILPAPGRTLRAGLTMKF
jgi:hemoglobin/transferrin/lactoferrin receptor protein